MVARSERRRGPERAQDIHGVGGRAAHEAPLIAERAQAAEGERVPEAGAADVLVEVGVVVGVDGRIIRCVVAA